MGDAEGAEGVADVAGEGADLGFGKVGDAEGGGVEFSGGAHGGADGNLTAVAGGKEGHFGGDVVAGVGHGIGVGAVEEFFDVFWGDETRFPLWAAGGGDVGEAGAGDLGLGLSECGGGGEGLAVEVGNVKDVAIHKMEFPYAAPSEGFGTGSADGAQPDDQHGGGLEAGEGFASEKRLGAGEGGNHWAKGQRTRWVPTGERVGGVVAHSGRAWSHRSAKRQPGA